MHLLLRTAALGTAFFILPVTSSFSAPLSCAPETPRISTPVILASSNSSQTKEMREAATVLRKIQHNITKALSENSSKEKFQNSIAAHIDFNRITALAVGTIWSLATPEQRALITNEFRTLLLRDLYTHISQFKNAKYKTLNKELDEENDIVVSSHIIQNDQVLSEIQWQLSKTPNGYKIHDVSAQGINFATKYRNEFNRHARQNGIDGLIKSLANYNARINSK